MDDEPLREFLAEADERIETLFADVARLRRVHASDGRARRELVARIFRHVHTLKGSAATVAELAPLSRLAHEFENLLDAVRRGRAPLTDAIVDACEDATNALSVILESAARGETAAEPPPVVLEQLRRHAAAGALDSHAAGNDFKAGASAAAAPALPEEIARGLSAVEWRHLSEAVREGAHLLVLAATFDLATLDEGFGRYTGALGECGEIISTFPGDMTDAAFGRISFHILYANTCAPAELEARLTPFGARIMWTGGAPERGDALPGTARAFAPFNAADDTPGTTFTAPVVAGESSLAHETNVTAGESSVVAEATGIAADAASATPDAASVAPDASDAAGASDGAWDARAPIFVRVPLRELDELVTATHELFTDTLAMLEQAATADAASASVAAQGARRLREDFGALEGRVMALRMQPLMPVLERAARAARIAARTAGKEIELEVAGGEVRVDRSLAERIGEPLLHLLRNAIDHGIETAAERRTAGKPVRGRVRLEVGAEGSRVRVRVADDGRGIDAERVARGAVAQGLLAADARLTEEQALRMIFRPGFSTAGRVSDVSGRGVGLDVVEHALERAGGDLRVRTTSGEGTTFELRVPLTLALVTVVVVRVNGHAYAFDASHVIATAEIESAAITRPDAGRCSALWRGEQLPFVSLGSLLEGTRAGDGAGEQLMRVCIVRRERDDAKAWQREGVPERFIVAVDDIEGEREALVRTLGRHATRWRGVSGAFEQRDGTVALLLDLPRLL